MCKSSDKVYAWVCMLSFMKSANTIISQLLFDWIVREKKCKKKLIEPTLEMAQPYENNDSKQYTLECNDCNDDDNRDNENEKANESIDDVHHLKFETTVVSSQKPIGWKSVQSLQQQQHQQHQPHQQQQHQQQTTVTYQRNGHSRNPSSINGITIATQVIQPPPNKPDAIQNLLKLIRFRSDYDECDEKSKNRQICGIREARLFSKCLCLFITRPPSTISHRMQSHTLSKRIEKIKVPFNRIEMRIRGVKYNDFNLKYYL